MDQFLWGMFRSLVSLKKLGKIIKKLKINFMEGHGLGSPEIEKYVLKCSFVYAF